MKDHHIVEGYLQSLQEQGFLDLMNRCLVVLGLENLHID